MTNNSDSYSRPNGTALWVLIALFLSLFVAIAAHAQRPAQGVIAPVEQPIDFNGFWKAFLEANPVDENLIRSVGVNRYGSATGAATDNGKPAFGWRFDHAVTSRELALAVIVNDARRPYAFVNAKNRSASPAAGLRPVGLEAPPGWWPWPDWIAGDYQHPWNAAWLLAVTRSPEAWTCEVPGIGARPVADVAKLRLGNLFAALAGVVRNGWLQVPHPVVNPDPSDRGYGLPLWVWGEYMRAGLAVELEDSRAFEGYFFAAMSFYEHAPGASFFTKLQTTQPPVPAGACYYLPAQLSQAVAGLWSVRRCVPVSHPLQPRIDTVLRRLCLDLAEKTLSINNARTPWPVTVNGGTLPALLPSGPYLPAVAHDPGFDVTPWLAHALAVGVALKIEPCVEKLARVIQLHSGDPAQKSWLVGSTGEYLVSGSIGVK